jgi:8-oxo-dGTP pyrophosphatase MutT (NUDIX family)
MVTLVAVVDPDRVDAVKERHSARLVLADPHGRVLLVRVVDDGSIARPGDDPVADTYWITPGGGVEAGETLEAAARRELFEETGIDAFELGPELFERRIELSLRGEELLAVEHYFAGVVTDVVPTLEHVDPLERGVLVEHRWWTPEDIVGRGPDVIVFPPNLAELATRAVHLGSERSRSGEDRT